MQRITRLLCYVRPYWLYLTASVLLMAAVGLLEGFRLLLISPIFDQVLHPASPTPRALALLPVSGAAHLSLQQVVPRFLHNAWTMVAFALVAATLLKGICEYSGTYLVNHAGFGMLTDLRNDLYNAILRRSAAFFDRHSTGSLISTLISDVERVQFAMSAVIAEFLQQFFTFIFIAATVVVYGGRLAALLLVFVPFVIFSAARIGKKVRHTTRRGQDKLAEIQTIIHETITGNRIVKAFGMEPWESSRFRSASKKLFRANLRSVRAQALSSPLMESAGAVAIAILLLLGRDLIRYQYFTVGSYVAFIIAVFKLYDPVRKFAQCNNSFQQALGASSEIFRFMDTTDDVVEKKDAHQLRKFSKSIVFKDVSFAYPTEEGPKAVLHNINLSIPAGEILAIVGPSGAGKSTLVNLIPRFFDVTSGRLLVDGHDVRDLTIASLRAQIGKVTQEIILFNDTVRNNIAYGQPNISLARVKEVAMAAMAHDFIMRLPEGYDTIIGERGMRLSGGERQRIAIARALLKDAPILILDEATSALDSESELLVQSALHNLMRNRTVFVIAHRLSTIRHADRIVVLENGRVCEAGPHDKLMQELGIYQRLYNSQFLELEPRAAAETSR